MMKKYVKPLVDLVFACGMELMTSGEFLVGREEDCGGANEFTW